MRVYDSTGVFYDSVTPLALLKTSSLPNEPRCGLFYVYLGFLFRLGAPRERLGNHAINITNMHIS